MAHFKRAADIKVGILGYGSSFGMGRIHFDAARRAGMTPVAVADADAARAQAGAEELGVPAYRSLAEMLKQSPTNFVILITPHNTHASLSLQALRAGAHVVCEKPLAITTQQCDRMIAAARKANVMLSTYHNRHWDGHVLRALKEIGRGAIGEVYRVECHMGAYGRPGDWWRSSRSISGGILYDWGVHLLEYTLQIVDAEVVEVSGFARRGVWAARTPWKDDTNDDEGFVVIRFANGVWATLCITQLDANPKPRLVEVSGTKGTYAFDEQGWELIQRDEKGQQRIQRGPNPPHEWDRYYQNVADYLCGRAELVITPEWSRRPIHILDLACQSVAKGRALPAKYA